MVNPLKLIELVVGVTTSTRGPTQALIICTGHQSSDIFKTCPELQKTFHCEKAFVGVCVAVLEHL